MPEDVALPEVETQVQEPEVQEPETQEGQEPEAQEGQEPETQETQRGKKSAQQRINEITKAKYDAEREAAYWRGIAEGSRPQTQQVPEPAAREPAAKPNLADFTDYETYIEALTDWKTTQKVTEVVHNQREATVQERQRAEALEVAKGWASKQEDARKSIPDYDEVLGGAETVVAPYVTDAILTSDRGPEVAYHLAKNPALAEKLNKLSPIAAAREIGRIEAALEKSSPGTSRSAPPPPARTTRSSATISGDPAKMDHEQYRAMRAKQGARWAR